MSKYICLGVAVLVFAVPPASAKRFNDREMDILNKGGVVRRVFPDSGENQVYGGSGWTVVNSSPRAVWEALQDWDSYTAMYPNTLESKELFHKPGRHILRMRLGHPILQVVYHVEMKPTWGNKRMAFSLMKNYPHDVEDIQGYWQLFPLSDGQTLVAYVFRVKVPDGMERFLTKSFQKMALHRLLGAPWHLKKWVEEKAPGKCCAS